MYGIFSQALMCKKVTGDENIIATIQMRNDFCYPLKTVIFPILR